MGNDPGVYCWYLQKAVVVFPVEIVGRRLRRAREGGGDEEKAKLRNVVKSA